jgi:long-chain acyl-CoA synthetase
MNSPLAGNRYGTVGKVLRDMHVVIDKSRVSADSPDGEIVVYGAHIMQGYHNKPKETEASMMSDTWKGFPGFRTGDRGWIDRDGYLHITGRFKEEYKLENGKYIHPVAIENEIKLVRYVANVIIYGEGRQFNVAIVVPDFQMLESDPATAAWSKGSHEEIISNKELTDFLSQEITAQLKKSFGGYEIPKKFLFVAEDFTVENGMLTQTLKLVRQKVIKHYNDKLKKLYEE